MGSSQKHSEHDSVVALLTAFPDIHFDLTDIVIGPQGVCEEARVTWVREMPRTSDRRMLFLLIIALAAGALPGCLAAGAAAGAATGIYLTTRGAESVVDGSIDDVEGRARAVFASEGIPVSGFQVERSGARRELHGTKGDLEVSVSMEQQGSDTTKTEVSARKNVAVWDKEYAQRLLGMIVKQPRTTPAK